ncbi:hypothetical protein PSEUBRA_004052 [Kalmanozyma brasiliensis GHG001]|uniref:uncharacterized protein n=1 Tax=Kalmanozyma brasiliensis (strain GHG001) TaxID=1365824 RepID=UPI002867EA79|nr:uncharacterized protein PSEUBRA_004052 [Kalmanozyma brasiliensis GHG001]KAF6767336.1 hypothetical protein PSEUBRA_004052 [Kalmanozyma brasiliensis GHG001]
MLSTSRNRKAVYDPTPTLEWLDVAHPLEYPRVVELPNDLRWDPSPALAGELLSLFESRLGYSRTDVADLTGGDRARLAHDLPTFKEAFGMNRFVYVFKLPTRPVLITAHTRSLFRQDNPHPVALVLWTIDQDSARAPVLSLRAAFGVKIGLYAKMRRRPGKAVYNPGSWTDGPSPRRLLWLHSHD